MLFFGLSPNGQFTEDEEVHGYPIQKNVTGRLTSWFETVTKNKMKYIHFESLHEMVDIYGPKHLAYSQIALEWVLVSGLVDPCAQLLRLQKNTEKHIQRRESHRLFEALDGFNHFNHFNLVIDFRYGIIVTRRNARRSGKYDNLLAQFPIDDIKKKFNLYSSTMETEQRKTEIRSRNNQLQEEAKELALAYIQKIFFSS